MTNEIARVEPNANLLLTVAQFRRLVSTASYNMTLEQFCTALGWTVDQYAYDKFKDFLEMGRLLQRFDPTTLESLLGAYQAAQTAHRPMPIALQREAQP